MQIMTTFGKKLIECRKAKGLTQQELAKKLNTVHTVIGRYERDEMKPTIDVAKKLANILETTIGYLLGEANNNDIFKDPEMLKRFNDIASFSDKERKCIIWTIDAMINNVKFESMSRTK
jgi:transcriptional regulator with XRE-family HTH domain